MAVVGPQDMTGHQGVALLTAEAGPKAMASPNNVGIWIDQAGSVDTHCSKWWTLGQFASHILTVHIRLAKIYNDKYEQCTMLQNMFYF